MKFEKILYKYSFFYVLLFAFLIAVVESLIKTRISFNYAICFCEGAIVNVFGFYLTAKIIDYIIYNSESKAKLLLIIINLVKLLLYAACMYLAYRIYEYGVFACAFGLLTIKVMIYFKYLILDSYYDKVMKIEDLGLPLIIINKFKMHDINKVQALRTQSKEELLEYLTEEEVAVVIKQLHEFEYFLKNELEVVIENEDDVNC